VTGSFSFRLQFQLDQPAGARALDGNSGSQPVLKPTFIALALYSDFQTADQWALE
jgi:hypothetical protein